MSRINCIEGEDAAIVAKCQVVTAGGVCAIYDKVRDKLSAKVVLKALIGQVLLQLQP
jgi:hypothetical protein